MATNPYTEIDRDILADAYSSDHTREVLLTLCDTIGPRFAGTDGERRGAEYIAEMLSMVDSVQIEEFPFKAWRRGKPAQLRVESRTGPRDIQCISLPYGSSTPPEGVSGELVDLGAGAAEDVEGLRDRIRGRIVITEATGAHRSEIYGRVTKAGAKGFVLKGRAPGMILPTGCVSFGVPGTIAAVGIAHESGLLIQRLLAGGDVSLSIRTSDSVGTGQSCNVVAELKGSKFPDEYVVIGGHMDSHDLAPGAVDNASGTTCVVEVARLLATQKPRLERSIRFVAFGAEEVGLLGSYRYAEVHADEMAATRMMLNLDCVSMSRPKGLVFHKVPGAADYVESLRAQLREPLPLFDRIHPHSDHFPFLLEGVPTAEIAGGRFNPGVASFAHMAGDTADKVSLIDLREQSALAARVLVRAANDSGWPFAQRTPEEVAALLKETGIDRTLSFERPETTQRAQ